MTRAINLFKRVSLLILPEVVEVLEAARAECDLVLPVRLLPVAGNPPRTEPMTLMEFNNSLMHVRKKATRRVRDEWVNFIMTKVRSTFSKFTPESGFYVDETKIAAYTVSLRSIMTSVFTTY
jgi:hypothetical protein